MRLRRRAPPPARPALNRSLRRARGSHKGAFLCIPRAELAEVSPPPRTNWTRLVLPPVLSGHVSSLQGFQATWATCDPSGLYVAAVCTHPGRAVSTLSLWETGTGEFVDCVRHLSPPPFVLIGHAVSFTPY
jgi:hypothetical protein